MNDESFNKIININKFDINKDIHITNIRNFYNNYKQVDIYNINCKTPLQKTISNFSESQFWNTSGNKYTNSG